MPSHGRVKNSLPMILHASADFAKRFKCAVSAAGPWRGQGRRIDAWSCHYVRLGQMPVVVAMHDATLYTLVIPVTGVKTFGDFWRLFLLRVAETWAAYGAEFDAANQTVVVLPRTDRTRIGSMNDAVRGFRWNGAQGDALESLEAAANRTPYKAIDYAYPADLLERMLG